MDKHTQYYLDLLKVFESRSTCHRLQVGGFLLKNGRIISSAWNGSPSRFRHCTDYMQKTKEGNPDISDKDLDDAHQYFSKKYEIHVEQNLICYAARSGISIEDSILFVSYSPCMDCTKLIINSGIKEVYYREIYDRAQENWDELFRITGIKHGFIEAEKNIKTSFSTSGDSPDLPLHQES